MWQLIRMNYDIKENIFNRKNIYFQKKKDIFKRDTIDLNLEFSFSRSMVVLGIEKPSCPTSDQ